MPPEFIMNKVERAIKTVPAASVTDLNSFPSPFFFHVLRIIIQLQVFVFPCWKCGAKWLNSLFNASPTGNPFLGTILVEVSIRRDLEAPKGLR